MLPYVPAWGPKLKRMQGLAPPSAVAAVSFLGLVAALLGDGCYDVIAWIMLSVPVGTVVWAIVKSRT